MNKKNVYIPKYVIIIIVGASWKLYPETASSSSSLLDFDNRRFLTNEKSLSGNCCCYKGQANIHPSILALLPTVSKRR